MALFKTISVFAAEGLGPIPAPDFIAKWTKAGDEPGQGIFTFLSVFISLSTVIAGIYLIVQLILAGYLYMSSNGDPKKIEIAGNKIWQSMVGLLIVAGALTLASVVARLAGIQSLFEFSFLPK